MDNTYIVKSGDTLYGISNQFGVSVTELASLNKVDANTLKVGQVLKIPTNYGNNPDTMFMYTVKKDDSLYSIAKKYNTTVEEIMNLNYLTNTNLSIGQIIRIPETYTKEEEMYMPNYTNYIVKKGDSLYSIAKKYNVSIDEIIKDNALENTNLKIGQVLKIKIDNDDNYIEEECIGEDFDIPSSNSFIIYKVKNGDNLYSIAKKYNTTINEIKSLNELKSNNLSINQELKIPSSDTIYIVKKGDSLYSIAKDFDTTINEIKNKNKLTSNLLSIGQQLII